MIQISFNFQDAAQVQAFLNRVLTPVEEALAPQDHTPETTPESTPAAAPKPRGRPRKEAVASAPDTAPAVVPSASPAAQAPASVDAAASPSVTIDDVRKTAELVVAKLGNDVGMAKAREIIRQVGGVVTIRDIPADKMAAVNSNLKTLL